MAAVFAVVDWVAVARNMRRLEYAFKPAVMVALIAVGVLAEPTKGSVRGLAVIALVCGLIGDVALMLEHTPTQTPHTRPVGGRRFLVGLGAFLLGHVFYALAMWLHGFDLLGGGMGLVLALLILLAFGFPILRGARRNGGMKIAVAVSFYMAALGSMLVFGVAAAAAFITYGAILFVLSDLILGGDRFVRPHPLARILIVVMYHLAQGMLIVGLVS